MINEDDIVSNDLSLVAPSADSNVQQQLENLPPFKLTPRGHSAPVIISQVIKKIAYLKEQNIKNGFEVKCGIWHF